MTSHIPLVDPSQIPMIVTDGQDWRSGYDTLREKYSFFRVGSDLAIWFTRYDACREILTDSALFWKGPLLEAGQDHSVLGDEQEPVWDRASADERAQRHIAVRQVLVSRFSPIEVRRWEDRLRSTCRSLIGRFADKGEADFVVDFARYFFPYIGCAMVGVPEEDWDLMVEWQHEVFKIPASDPDGGDMALDQYRVSEAMANIVGYLNDLTEKTRSSMNDSFIGYVLNAEAQGLLTDKESRWAIRILTLGSGHTVTSHLGYIFHTLAQRPELQARMITNPEHIDPVCEEILRINALFGHTRTVTEDVTFHGCDLKRGDTVFVCYTMPNRDPRVQGFDEEHFDRLRNPHLAFNQGWRQCLGMHFAKKARLIAVEEWHKRIPRYRIRPGSRLAEQVYAGVGYHELPLIWDDRASS